MIRIEHACTAVLMMGMTAACTQPVNDLPGSLASASKSASTDDSTPAKKSASKDESPTYAETESPPGDTLAPPTSTPTKAAAPLGIDVNFNGAAGQQFDANVKIFRSCSDMGVDFNQASVADGTSLMLVDVYTKKVVATLEGAAFQAAQQELTDGDGKLHVPVDAGVIPTTAAEYAIVIGGDDRFGSPDACGVDIAPHDDKDRGVKGSAGNFPTGRVIVATRAIGGSGCGIVGFLQAYYDAGSGQVVARPSSPIVIAADNEGRAGFPAGSTHLGCDEHESPLVVDLGGKGITLGAITPDTFDIDGDGKRDALGWVSSSDTPFLVRDTNANGIVDGPTELFGNRTVSSALNGFEALAKFDANADGQIDARDPVWSTLRLWSDKNHDGRTDEGELETLPARGVASLATGYIDVKEQLATGTIRQRGGATLTNDRIAPIADVWFDRRF